MADYPKTYVKGDNTRVAHNRRDEVKLKFDGFRVVEEPEAEEAAAPEVEATEAPAAKSTAKK